MPNIRKKGAAAELEWLHRFQPFFIPELKRNLEQTRSGGHDITGCEPWVVEVKRVEDTCQGNKNSWWRQARASVKDYNTEIPVVSFRPSRKPWRFLVPVSLFGIESEEYAEISEDVWLKLVFKFQPAPF